MHAPVPRTRRLAAVATAAALIAGALMAAPAAAAAPPRPSIRRTLTSARTSRSSVRTRRSPTSSRPSMRSPTSSAMPRWARLVTRCTSCRASTARMRLPCSSRWATTPRSPASAPIRATSTSTGPSRSTTAASPMGARATASPWSTSGAPSPTCHIDVNKAGQDGCRQSANFWAVSQAVSMRRVDVTGNVSLMDYCTAGPQYASGGYIGDTRLQTVTNGSQQQWLTRNSEVTNWSNAVWNQVFSGVVGAPADAAFPDPPYTTIDEDTDQPREAVPVRRRPGPLQRPRAGVSSESPAASAGAPARQQVAASRSRTST